MRNNEEERRTQLLTSSSELTQIQVANTVKRHSENSTQPSASTVSVCRQLPVWVVMYQHSPK
jgi:hypothetical protein